ncbi:MAG: DUF2232 domain-containing protein [Clostridia bacterium]|nr:DUF2232 domain-containing protein [Clostridia bacterium]
MISDRPYRPSGGKVALGVVLAVLLGIAAPALTALETALLLPVILLSGVLMVFLHGYAGRLPAWLFMTVQLGAAAVLLGPTFMWMLMAAGTFPAILSMRGILTKRPFFEQMKLDIGFYLAGLLAAVTIAWSVFGGNMIPRAVDALRAQFELTPDLFFLPFVEAVNAAMPGTTVTVAGYRAQVMAVLELLGETYERMLPGTLLSGAALSGVLTALWGNWLMARHGMATNESYISLERWFLPKQATAGLLLMWVAAYILSETGYQGGESVYMAVYALVSLAFYIQGLCAVDRFMFRRGASSGRRRFVVILGLILGAIFRLFNTFLFVVGAFSALFGSHGAISRRVEIRVERRDDDDDDDDDND